MIRIFENYILRFSELSDLQWALLVFFFVVFLFRLGYRLMFSFWLFKKRKINDENNTESISLILTVRNQEHDIQKFLPGVLSAAGKLHEVIVVDDFSQDNSLSRLGILKTIYPQLYISSLSQETRHSVKLAHNIALKAAKNSWIKAVPLNTDSITDDWFNSIQNSLLEKNNVVLNYSNIVPGKGFINLFIRIENLLQQLRSYGFCAAGLPFVYDETNVTFRKEKYFEAGGYGLKIKENHANLELILNMFMKKRQLAFNINSESAVMKTDEVSWNDYFDLLQKNNRIEKHLPGLKRLFLRIEKMSEALLIPVFALLCFVIPDLWFFYVVPALFLFILHLLIIKSLLNRLKEHKLFLSSLIYALFRIYLSTLYQIRINYRNRKSKKNKWKSKI